MIPKGFEIGVIILLGMIAMLLSAILGVLFTISSNTRKQ